MFYICVVNMTKHKQNTMTTLELIQSLNKKANQTKKELTKSFFSGDKKYFNEMLNSFPKANVNGNVYETINNIASMYARGLDY